MNDEREQKAGAKKTKRKGSGVGHVGGWKKNGFRRIKRSRAALSGGKCSLGRNLVMGLSIHLCNKCVSQFEPIDSS